MKSRILMAALVVTLLMGARVYASDCGPCDPACDPCGSCDNCSRSCDLFSGLKSLVACKPCTAGECSPCDGVVACSPCDEAVCNPCDEISCDDACGKSFSFGKRLKNLFASRNCNPCDEVGNCDPCGDVTDCNPCDNTACNEQRFTLRKLFKGFKLVSHNSCNPCDEVGCGNGDDGCNPCDEVGCGDGDSCNPCDEINCGAKFGHLLDRPRRSVKRFFDGFSLGKCDTSCNPCDAVCSPCNDVTCFGSQLPEAGK